ncbi:MAG TPA: hypothetical protein VH020_09625 [Stellaceae bacterium]|jgi:hypothetical protein|nr:hypothetical protein [Stellaceae bacterium]
MAHDTKRKLPRDLVHAVGTLIVTASLVDKQVGLQIIRMISPIQFIFMHAWPVVSGMDFKVKLALIRSLASYGDKASRDYIVECCDALQKNYQKRNLIAHGATNFVRRKDGKYLFSSMLMDAKKGRFRDPLWASPKEIEEWGSQLFSWSNELEQSLTDLGYPIEGPNEAYIGERSPVRAKVARRDKTHTHRTIRKRSPPLSEKS